MFNSKQTFFIFISLLLFNCISNAIPEFNLTGSVSIPFENQSHSNIMRFNCKAPFEQYIRIKVERSITNNFKYHIIADDTEDVGNFENVYTFKSEGNDHVLYVTPSLRYNQIEYALYVNVLTEEGNVGSYTLNITYMSHIDLSLDKDYSFPHDFIDEEQYFKLQMPQEKNDIYLYLLAPKSFMEERNRLIKEISLHEQYGKFLLDYEIIENAFYGGKLIKISTKFLDSTPFDPKNFIEIILNEEEQMDADNYFFTVGVDLFNSLNDIIDIGYSKYGHVDSSFGSKRCYDVSTKNEELFNSVITTTSGVNVFLSNHKKGGNKVKETKILLSGHFSFTKSEIELNKYICFAPLNGNDIAYYQIQIIDATDLSVGKLLYDPLVGGVPYNIELQPNGYQLLFYNDISNSKADYRIHEVIEEIGKIEVFRFTTKKNPLINFTKASSLNSTKDDIELENQNGILLDFKDDSSLEDNEYILLAVYCKPENTQPCVFDVNTFNSYEFALLKENKPKMTLLFKNFSFMYKFNVADKTVHTIYLEMTFMNMVEDTFKIEKDGEEITSQLKKLYFENKLVYVITREQMNNNLIGTYQFLNLLTTGEGSIHKINYYVKRDNKEKEIEIHSGFQETYYLNVNEKAFYNVKNVFSLSEKPFITLFQPVNCQIKVFFINNGKEEELSFNNEDYIQHTISPAKENYFRYSVQALSLTNDYSNMCSVIISTTSLDENAKLILGEEMPLKFKFNKQFREINLGYLSKHILSSDKFLIHVQTNSDTILDVSNPNIDDLYTSHKIFHQNIIPFLFERDDVDELIENKYIINDFTLSIFPESLYNKDLENDVEVEVKVYDSNSPISKYLHKSSLKMNFVATEDKKVIYYAELKENDEGYVNIHFERGSGELTGIIVEKEQFNIFDENEIYEFINFGDRFYILNGNNYSDRKLYYTKDHTKKCKDGCFLVLILTYGESAEKLKIDKSQLYITPIVSDPIPITIPLNEFIFGSIVNTSLNDYFTVKVPKEYKQIEIQFQSDVCQMYINEGTVKPSENNKIASIDSRTQTYLHTINTNEVEKRYTFAISCKEFSHIDKSPYKFRVRTINKEIEELIEVHSPNELKCTIKEDKSFCDFLIMNDKLFTGTENFIYVKTDNTASPVVIYATLIRDDKYFELSSEQKREILPRPGQEDVNSLSQFNKTYLYFYDLDDDELVLVSVYSEQKATITFFDSYKINKNELIVNYYTPTLVFLENEEVNLILPQGIDHYVTIEGIHSQGELVYNSNSVFGYIDEGSQMHFNYTYDYSYNSRNEYLLSYKHTDEDEPNVFLIWVTNQQPDTIVGEIEIGKSDVTHLQAKDFPIIQYAKIYSSEDIIYNFQTYTNVNENEVDDFILEGYVVDNEFLLKLKVDHTIKPSSNKINGDYDKYSKMGYIYFPSEDIQLNSQTQNYLLIIISKLSDDNYGYETFHFGHSLIYASNPNVPIAKYFYYNGLVLPKLKANIYSLSKIDYKNTHMMIELFLSNTNIDFAISDDSSFESLVNKTNIIVDHKNSSEGHNRVIVDLKQTVGDFVYIALFSKERTTIDLHFTLRYSVYVTLPQINFGTMNITTDNNSFEFLILPFYSQPRPKCLTEYVIRFYDKNSIPSSDTIITPFSLLTPQVAENTLNSYTYLLENITPKSYPGTYQISVTAIIKDLFGIPLMIETFPIREYNIQYKLDEFGYGNVNIRNYNTFLSEGYMWFNLTDTYTILNVKLTNFTYNKRNTMKDLFTVTAYYVDEAFIDNKTKDHTLQPTTTAFTSKQYLIDNNLIVEMTNQGDHPEYIYFVINPDESNTNNYADYTIEVIAYSPVTVPPFVTPQNHNYIGKLNSNVNKTNYYLLKKESEDIKYIVLYFSNKMNSKPITFSIESYELELYPTPTKQNSTDLTFSSTGTVNGITYINVELPSNKTHFLVSVYSQDNDEIEYSFKWNSFSTSPQLTEFNYNAYINDYGWFANLYFMNYAFYPSNDFQHLDYIIRVYRKKDLNGIDEPETAFIEYEGDNSKINPVYEEIITQVTHEGVAQLLLMKLNISIEEEYIIKIIAYGSDIMTGEEIKLSGNSDIITPLNMFVSFNELFSAEFNDLNQVKFIKLPDDINDFTFLIKSNSRVYASVGFVDEKTMENVFDFNYGGLQSISIYNSREYTNAINLHRDDPSKKYFCIKGYVFFQSSSFNGVLTAYNGKINDFVFPQKQYFIDSLDSQKDVYKIYKLQKQHQNETVIEVEFAFMYNNYIYSIEDYIEGKEPTFTTNSNKILKKEEKHGKVRIAYDVTNVNTILLSFKPTSSTRNIQNISYQFKYKSYVSMNDYVEYPDNLDINTDKGISFVKLPNPFYGYQMNNLSIHYSIYKISPFTKTLNSMYMPSFDDRAEDEELSKYFVSEDSFDATFNEQHYYLNISYPHDGSCYVKAVISSTDSNGELFKMAYNLLEISLEKRPVFEIDFGQKEEQDKIYVDYSDKVISFYSKIIKQPYVDFTKHLITAHLIYKFDTHIDEPSFNIEGYIVSKEIIDELLLHDLSEIPGKQAIEVFQFKEASNIDINFPMLEDPNIESKYVLINLKFKEYNPRLSEEGLEITFKGLKIFPNIQPTLDYLKYMNVFTLNKNKNTITFLYQCEDEFYIEFGERYNSKDLDIAIENNNTFATFQNTTNIIYDNVKGGKRVIEAECPQDELIMFSFINKGQDDLALFFINYQNLSITENYLEFNDYNSQLNINPEYDQGKISLTFHNVYSVLNEEFINFNEDIYMNYSISLYRVDDVLTNTNKYDSLFPFDNDDEHKIQPNIAKKLLVDSMLNNVTTSLIVGKNKLYYVKIRFQYFGKYPFNFGYDLVLLNTTATYFYEIKPTKLEPYCIEQGFSSLALYMPINANEYTLPSFTFRFSNIQSNKENAMNSIKINGYTVNNTFILNKQADYSEPATDPSVEANYFHFEKAAFLSLNNLNMNQYAYLEITSDTKEIDSICFDVYPFYPGKVPNHSLIPNKFMYHIMQTPNVTYKLTANDINNKYYVIEIIKSKNSNVSFIIETYKETPLYTDDINVTSTEDKEKIVFTINTDNITQSDKSLLVHAMIKEQSSKMIQRNLQEVNTNDNYFFIKYTTHSNTPIQIQYNKTITVARNNTGIEVSFDNVMNNYLYDLSSVKYYISVYTDKIVKNINEINTYIVQSNAVPILSKEINANPNNEKINEYYEVADTYSGNNLYLRVTAEIIIDEKEEQKLLYEITTVSPNKSGLGTVLWIIIGVAVLILLIVIGFIIKAKRKTAGSNIDTKKFKKELSLLDNDGLV